MSRPSFFELAPPALADYAAAHDLPPYLGEQLLDWVYRKGVVDPAAMTNVARRHREILAETLDFYTTSVDADQLASDGTRKLLLEMAGGRRTECVMIPAEGRRTGCLSSQVGCPVGCRFCASGIGGLEANLRAGLIVEQAHRLGRLDPAGPLTHVVFMGMGEPLSNFAAVTDAIRTIHAPWGLGLGARRITISTVGLPAAIRRLVDFELPVTLALSLHAPNDELRRELIPWAEYAGIAELLEACAAYFEKTGREITLEYLLLRGVNDRPEHARQLAEVAKTLRANVNLIRYNEVRGLPFDRPTTEDVHRFQQILRAARVNVHIRASRGRDIAAACGQLRHERGEKGTFRNS